MRKHLWQSDGRLKTGRISLIFFLCLLLGLGLLFKLQQPVGKAIVVVRHIFAATPKIEPETKAKKVETAAEIKPKTTVKPKQVEPEPQPEPVKVARIETVEKLTSPAVKTTQKPEKVQAAEKAVPESSAEKPVAELKDKKIAKSPASPPAAVAENSSVPPVKNPVQDIKVVPPVVPETKTVSIDDLAVEVKPQAVSSATDILTEELVVAPPLLQAPMPQSSVSQAEEPDGQTAVTLLTKAQRQLLSLKPVAAKPGKKSGSPVKFAAIKPLKVKKTATKEPVKTVKSDFKAVSANPSTKPKVVKTGKASGITVARKEYKKLHHAWQAAGRSEKDNDHVIPLQIENLRAAYDLLQMKAVVIRPDESCIDLTDGSRIPAASLDRFSSTVLRVDDPWQKWGTQLKAAGLKPGQSFKVRYYLYDFVRRSIYVRVNQAYRWSLAKGLIQPKTKPDEVDVLGRTFVIKRSGGGAFGVFVPLSLKTSDGRQIEIDPVCFSNAPDINALHLAGLI